jgi:hypothetical protein
MSAQSICVLAIVTDVRMLEHINQHVVNTISIIEDFYNYFGINVWQ